MRLSCGGTTHPHTACLLQHKSHIYQPHASVQGCLKIWAPAVQVRMQLAVSCAAQLQRLLQQEELWQRGSEGF